MQMSAWTENVQCQRIVSLISRVLQLTFAAMFDTLISEEKVNHCNDTPRHTTVEKLLGNPARLQTKPHGDTTLYHRISCSQQFLFGSLGPHGSSRQKVNGHVSWGRICTRVVTHLRTGNFATKLPLGVGLTGTIELLGNWNETRIHVFEFRVGVVAARSFWAWIFRFSVRAFRIGVCSLVPLLEWET